MADTVMSFPSGHQLAHYEIVEPMMVRGVDLKREPVTETHLVQNWLTELERLVPTDD